MRGGKEITSSVIANEVAVSTKTTLPPSFLYEEVIIAAAAWLYLNFVTRLFIVTCAGLLSFLVASHIAVRHVIQLFCPSIQQNNVSPLIERLERKVLLRWTTKTTGNSPPAWKQEKTGRGSFAKAVAEPRSQRDNWRQKAT
jgi:hypothetical protein